MSQSVLLKQPISKLKSMIPAATMTKMSASFQKLPLSEKVIESYIESSCFRKLVRPLTIPGKLWLTYEIIRNTSTRKANDSLLKHF